MRFSDDRLAHLAHLVRDALRKEKLVTIVDEDKALREIRKSLIDYFKVEEVADETARAKIASLKRDVPEGSREWDILYRKYVEEELSKKGH